MIDRFQGRHGRARLVRSLREQKLVGNDEPLAVQLARRIVLKPLRRNQVLIRQGAVDTALYFLLSGTVAVLVNGREVAARHAGDHIGEMSLLGAGARRSATVVAVTPSVAARISESAFSAVADAHPGLWRSMAEQLAERLRQRARFVLEPNARPKLFIGSSREALRIAKAVVRGLRGARVEPVLWWDGVFGASRFPMEDLEKQVRGADFALLVATADDLVVSRGDAKRAPRDNVVFELGLFMGAISRHRTFLLTPRGVDVKIPSDLLGLNPLSFDPARKSLKAATAAACAELQRAIRTLKPR